MEDKQLILTKLVESLRLTRAYGGNDEIKLIKVYRDERGEEWAQVIFGSMEDKPLDEQPKENRFCITGDSGIACIYDFCNWSRRHC